MILEKSLSLVLWTTLRNFFLMVFFFFWFTSSLFLMYSDATSGHYDRWNVSRSISTLLSILSFSLKSSRKVYYWVENSRTREGPTTWMGKAQVDITMTQILKEIPKNCHDSSTSSATSICRLQIFFHLTKSPSFDQSIAICNHFSQEHYYANPRKLTLKCFQLTKHFAG